MPASSHNSNRNNNNNNSSGSSSSHSRSTPVPDHPGIDRAVTPHRVPPIPPSSPPAAAAALAAAADALEAHACHPAAPVSETADYDDAPADCLVAALADRKITMRSGRDTLCALSVPAVVPPSHVLFTRSAFPRRRSAADGSVARAAERIAAVLEHLHPRLAPLGDAGQGRDEDGDI
ncbi:hypothetical protein HK405_010178 [Cladochytrium tenue]|nr:hypothetical protein HK405_010178 [Cladochytrium tenue]